MRLFLDANIFFAAAGSPKGGSAFVLELAKRTKLQLVTVSYALIEAERNIKKKLDSEALVRHYQNLLDADLNIQGVERVSTDTIAQFEKIIIQKDIPILLGAISADVDFLVTLDKKDFLENKKLASMNLPFEILTPGEFLKRYLEDKER